MKRAVVTGAASGIGKAVAERLVNAGYRVLAVDKTDAPSPGEVVVSDLCDPEDPTLAALSEGLLERLDGRLDLLVNNAAYQHVAPLEEITQRDWTETLQVNLLAPFWLTRRLSGALGAHRGAVVNVASVHAALTKPGFCVYATSKGALVTLTRSLALELAPRVRVNAVLPAATRTPMLEDGFKSSPAQMSTLGAFHPIGRVAEAGEVAEVVCFLGGPGAGYVTGAAWEVDGGIGSLLHDPGAA